MNKIILLILLAIIFVITILYFVYSFYFKEDFKQKKNNKSRKLTLYYTPWCHHCKELKPKWIEFMNDNEYNDLEIDMINCDENQMICNKQNIEFIPAIIIERENNKIVYEGEKTIEKIKNWIDSN